MTVLLTAVDWSKDGSTYRFLLSTLMVGQPPNWKGVIESPKGDKSFRIWNPNNWSSWHLLLTRYHAQLVDSALLHHIHSFLAAWCIIVSYCHFSFSHHVLLEILHFRNCMHDKKHEKHLLLTYHQLIPPFSVVTTPSSRKCHCVVLSLSFSLSSCVMILHFRSKVYAWQGTWKHDFKCISHEYRYIKICKFKNSIYSWTFA